MFRFLKSKSEPKVSKPTLSSSAPPRKQIAIPLKVWSPTSNSWEDYRAPSKAAAPTIHAPRERTLNIATWNVWFDGKTYPKARWSALYDLIFRTREQQPVHLDVVAFQEMTKDSYSQLLDLPDVQEDWLVTDFYTVLQETGSWYGITLKIRKQWLQENGLHCSNAVLTKYKSFMGRAFLAIELCDSNGVALRIGTSHFESGDRDEAIRREQFTTVAQLFGLAHDQSIAIPELNAGTAKRIPPSIICGDTNIYNPTELDILKNSSPPFIDTYASIRNPSEGNPHYTYGTTYTGLHAKRIDFVLLCNGSDPDQPESSAEVVDARLVGDESIEGESCASGRELKLYPSDHLGVVVSLKGL